MEQRPRILAVDDDKTVLRLLSACLSLEGYEVIAAEGVSALELFQQNNADLILLDIVMPGYNGFDVLEIIRKSSHVPIIMLTATKDPLSIESALISGADDYIIKPFSVKILAARIKARLKHTLIPRISLLQQVKTKIEESSAFHYNTC